MIHLLNVFILAFSLSSTTVAHAYSQVTSSSACFTQTAYANSTFMCPDRTFIVSVSDYYAPHQRFDTVTCCYLKAGPYDVELLSRPIQSQWVSAYTATTCGGNGALKGISFNPAGAPSVIHCAETGAASRVIYRNDPYNTNAYPIYPHSQTRCRYDEVAVGVGDIFNPDGDNDSFHCAGFYMP